MNPYYEVLKIQADSIPLSDIFNHFKLDTNNNFASHVSCPFPTHVHNSGTPSLKVYTTTNSFYCFGCNKGGTTTNFTKNYLNVKTFEEALDYLKKHFDLKSRSLTSTFNKIRKKVQDKTTDIDREVLIVPYETKVSTLGRFILTNTKNENTHLFIYYVYDCFDNLIYLFLNKLIDKQNFHIRAEDIISNLSKTLKKCIIEQELIENDVIDAENIHPLIL